MLAAFVTGFAKEASSMIDERNKEISDRALSEMEALLKKKARADEAAMERRDELRKQAAELRARSGNRLTESQIVGILESGYGEIALEKLKSKSVGTADMQRLFTPTDPEDKRLVEDYIKTATTLTGAAPKERLDEEGAFGLRSRAGTRVREKAASIAGMPVEDLYKAELPEIGVKPTGTLDLSMFEDEASVKEMEDSLVKTIIDPEATKEDKSAATQTLAKIRAAQDIGKKKEGSEVKESDVRSNLRLLDATIKRSIAGPGDLVVFTNPDTGEQSLELSNDIDPKVRQQIESRRREAFQAYANQYYGQTGSIPSSVRRVMSAFLGPEQAAAPAPAPAPAPATGLITVTDPTGKVHRFKTQKEADAFKKAAGIK